jgi:DNA polymerase III, alpha subunit (EC 2.7.7.7)
MLKAKEAGIKPILGMEAYIVEDIEKKDRNYYHLTILAMNEKGWKIL